MPAQRHEHIWSAIIRAILGLRRDNQLAEAIDSTLIKHLGQTAGTAMEPRTSFGHLRALFDATPLPLIRHNLAHYLDLNRMGSLVVAMISSATIAESLKLLHAFPGSFFLTDKAGSLRIERGNATTTVRWPASASSVEDGLYVCILLAVFRYQAGQRMAFDRITLPEASLPILPPGSAVTQESNTLCELVIATKWCAMPSFHANPVLQQAVRKTLTPEQSNTMRDRVVACIDKASQPARLRLPGIADDLGLNEVTVRKQLKEEAVSFSQLLKRAIHDRATHQLLSGAKAQDIAEQLGFSDRRAFDRSFKEFTGITPGQLRQLGNRLRFQQGNHQLSDFVTSLPPLPKTVQSILRLDDDAMRLKDVVAIIQQDPIFRAHIMAKASRAVFGRPPDSLEQALSRNLGLANIKSLAVLFAAQQQLSEQSLFNDIELLTDCMLLSARLAVTLAPQESETILLFGLLSLLLLFHQDCVFARRAITLWQSCGDFSQFKDELKDTAGVCVYSASSLMLLKWGMSGDVNRKLWMLCDSAQTNTFEDKQAILLCHNIAMQQILPGADESDACETLLSGLSDSQRDTIMSTLAAWKQR